MKIFDAFNIVNKIIRLIFESQSLQGPTFLNLCLSHDRQKLTIKFSGSEKNPSL